MKNKIILGSFIVLASVAHAQWNGTGGQSTDIYRTGNVRVGGNSTLNQTMHIGDGIGSLHFGSNGLLIKFSNADALLELHEPTGAKKMTIKTSGTESSVSNVAGATPLLLNSLGGFVGVNTDAPSDQLHIKTAIFNGGIAIDQAQLGSGASALTLKNSTTGGKTWLLGSSGASNPGGVGNFILNDQGLNENRLFIQGSNGHVGLGTSAPGINKLQVTKTLAANDNLFSCYRGIYSNMTNNNGQLAIKGESSGNTGTAIGVRGLARNSGNVNYGGHFSVVDNSTAFGINTQATGIAGSTNFGVYAECTTGGASSWAGYFQGDVRITKTLYTTSGSVIFSDQSLKKNIAPIGAAISSISKLHPISFISENQKIQYNLTEDVENVLPDMVYTTKAEKMIDDKSESQLNAVEKNVAQPQMITLLVKAVQEQQAQIELRKKENAELSEKITRLKKGLLDLKAQPSASHKNKF